MKNNCAVIIIDTGFSREAIGLVRNLVAVADLTTGMTRQGDPYIALDDDALPLFAADPLNHGSLVLKALMAINADLPVVLIRAYSDEVKLIRTGWRDGQIASPGWTEAYLWAVDLLNKRGLASVTNCSFGGYTHAMDGTGWEAFSLGKVSGSGLPGHIVVAGAGAGDGRALRASLAVGTGSSEQVLCRQMESTTYNFWCRAPADSDAGRSWSLQVYLEGQQVFSQQAGEVPGNVWNGRQQSTFTIYGAGQVVFQVSRESGGPEPTWFDCYINHQDQAVFLDHVNSSTIAEPAVFPGVIAVGLQKGSYCPGQTVPGAKPDVLLPGDGPVSFRLPEVTAAVAAWLCEEPGLDVDAVRARLGKYPRL
ncbi:MAG: hypothetical protein KC777_13785 [Cyanobacteria bacterium HKST-UBA02]|nr:hypothetical protein [Cyanobacteria bacterium HKST-UBA02]